jgi:hypothetical protein
VRVQEARRGARWWLNLEAEVEHRDAGEAWAVTKRWISTGKRTIGGRPPELG